MVHEPQGYPKWLGDPCEFIKESIGGLGTAVGVKADVSFLGCNGSLKLDLSGDEAESRGEDKVPGFDLSEIPEGEVDQYLLGIVDAAQGRETNEAANAAYATVKRIASSDAKPVIKTSSLYLGIQKLALPRRGSRRGRGEKEIWATGRR